MTKIKVSALDYVLVLAIIVLCLLLTLWPRAKGQTAAVTITPTSCPQASVGNFYFCQLTATGGTPPYKWTMPPLATFEAQYPGMQYKVTGPNNSILEIWGVPQEPNDGSALLPHPPSGAKEMEN
jgi:hypothetical protein